MLSKELSIKSLENKISKLSDEQARFIFLRVFHNGHKSRYPNRDPNQYRESYKTELYNRVYKEDKIDKMCECIDKIHTLFLEDEYLTWIKYDTRAQLFVYNYLVINKMVSPIRFGTNDRKDIQDTVHNILNILNNLIDGLHNRESFISEIEYKKRIINVIRSKWYTLKNNDNYSKWLKKADLEWVYNYLVEKNIYLYDMENYVNNDNRELRLLSSIDAVDIKLEKDQHPEPSLNKQFIIDKMKRAWSQQKYRDAGKTKKLYHLPLTKKTKIRLEKMAQVKGLSETAMLDILINRFYELDYIDVDGGKDLY